jgi:peroxiredoxin
MMAERGVAVGSRAPTFRLPSAQGGIVDLASFRGRSHVIVWFSKGFGCPFCRQQKSRLARGYPKFQSLKAELLEVTRTPVARAQLYARRFPLTFPYLCDVDDVARRAYGLASRPYAISDYVGGMLGALWRPKAFPDDYGPSDRFGTLPGVRASARELYQVMSDEDTGFFIIDYSDLVRLADYGPHRADGGRGVMREPPPNDRIIEALERCERPLP